MPAQPPASLPIALREAYNCLKIEDTTITDGDVVVAFWASSAAAKAQALKVIAHHRQSKWLAFIRTVLPHLTHQNVALLASQDSSTATSSSPKNVKLEGKNVKVEGNKVKTEGSSGPSKLNAATNSQSGTQHPNVSLTTAKEKSNGDIAMNLASPNDGATTPSEDNVSTYSDSTSTLANEEDSADSDIDARIGGKYWNGHSWRCEECDDELVDGKCPNSHLINPCKNCGRDFQPDACSRYCDECHAGLQEQCSACGPEAHKEQDTSDGTKMVWDDNNEVWRCTVCSWEIEANSEEEGQCHCGAEPEQTPLDYGGQENYFEYQEITYLPSERRIELLCYHEYEPADSDSSGAESTDSEPDSEDQAFIEDDGPFDPTVLTSEGLPNPTKQQEKTGDIMDTD